MAMIIDKEDKSGEQRYISYAKDIGFVAVAQIAAILLRFLQLPLLTKWLGATLYGMWTIIWVTTVILTPLVMLGLGIAMTRFLAGEKDIRRIRDSFLSIIFAVFIVGISVSFLFIACSDIFAASLLGNVTETNLVKLSALMITTQAISQINFAFFRTFRQMKVYSACLLGKAVGEIALMACFLSTGFELTGVIVAVIASDVLCIAVFSFITLRQIGLCLPHFIELKTYLRYGLPLIPTSAMLWIISSGDRYIIEYFMGAKDVGVYTAAYSLANIIVYFVAAIGTVLFPTISKSYDAGSIALTKTYLKYSLKYLMMLSIPCAFGLSILASPLLSILTTPEFTAGSTVVPFVAFGLLFYCLHQVCVHLLYLAGKTHWVLSLLCISVILNIGVNIVLIPYLGIIGAGITTLITFVILGISTLIVSAKYLKFDIGLPTIMKSLITSAVMAFIIWLLNPVGIKEIVLSILLAITFYSGIMLLLKAVSKEEIALLKRMFSFNIKKKT